jgi:hypothetical protein
VKIEESKWLNPPGLFYEIGGVQPAVCEETYKLLGEIPYSICDECRLERYRSEKRQGSMKVLAVLGGFLVYCFLWYLLVLPLLGWLLRKETSWSLWTLLVVFLVTAITPIILLVNWYKKGDDIIPLLKSRDQSLHDFALAIWIEKPGTGFAEQCRYSYGGATKGDIIYISDAYFATCVVDGDVVRYKGGGPFGSR